MSLLEVRGSDLGRRIGYSYILFCRLPVCSSLFAYIGLNLLLPYLYLLVIHVHLSIYSALRCTTCAVGITKEYRL